MNEVTQILSEIVQGDNSASSDRAGVIRTWKFGEPNAAIGEKEFENLPTAFRANSGRAFAIDFSPNGDRLLSAGIDGTIRAWTAGDSPVGDLKMSTPCVAAFSVAGDDVIVTGSQGISVWNRRNHETRSFGQKHQDWGSCLALSADGRTLATDHADGAVRLWNIKTGDVQGLIQMHEDTLEGLDFSPDGSLLITAGWNGTCKLWDHTTGQLTRVIHTPPHCEDATFAPDVRARFPRRTML